MRVLRVFWAFFALFFLGTVPLSAATNKIAVPKKNGGFQDFQDTQRADEITISDDTALLDSQTKSKLKSIKDNEHVTPDIKQAIDHLLRMNAASAQAASSHPPAGAAGVNYGQAHGFKNLDARPAADGRQSLKDRERSIETPEAFDTSIPLDLGARRESFDGNSTSLIDTGHPLNPRALSDAPRPSAQKRPRGFENLIRRRRRSAKPAPKPILREPVREARSREREISGPLLPTLERVREMIRERRFTAALDALGAILGQDPKNAEARILLPLVLFELGRFEAAIAAADHAIRLHPISAEAYFVRALAFERIGMETRKMMDLRRAAVLNPDRFGSYLRRIQAGELRIFDPAVGDQFNLLDAVAPRGPDPKRRTGGAIPGILLLAGLAGLLLWGIFRSLNLVARSGTGPRTGRSVLQDFWTGRRGSSVLSPTSPPVRVVQKLRKHQVLAGKYKLTRYLGRDGTVEVWRVQDVSLDRAAILMRLYSGPEHSEERALRLEEARSAAALRHPNIVDVYEVLDLPQGLFIVYEHYSGKSVRQVLEKNEKIPLSQIGGILGPVCRALEHAHHRGVAHGGLSPERILITKEGYIKVSQFVLARTTGEGAERYSAPEAKRGELKAVSDIYSLALCCHEMLAGAPPGDPAGKIDERLEALLEPALDLDHRTRTPSAKDFLRILRRLSAQPGTSTEAAA